MKIKNKHNYRNYLIVLLILLYNTSPFFSKLTYQLWFPVFILILLLVNKKALQNKNFFYFIIAVYFLIIIQAALFGGFTPASVYKPIMFFVTPFLIYKLMGKAYFKYLFNIIYYSSIVVTIFWILNNIYPNYFNSLAYYAFQFNWDVRPRSLLFYTVEIARFDFLSVPLIRNSGFFHEPGAFSIYLILAILLNCIYTHNYFNKKNFILLVILLTTFSTTGYIVIALFLLYGILKNPIFNKSYIGVFSKVFILFFFVSYSYNIFQKTEFLLPKIETRFQDQVTAYEQNRYGERGRFYAFFTSLKLTLRNPLTGRGIIEKNKYKEIVPGSAIGYGFTGLLMQYGIIVGFLFLWFFYKGILYLCQYNNMPKSFAITSFLLINMALMTQGFFFHIPFTVLFIIGLIDKQKDNV